MYKNKKEFSAEQKEEIIKMFIEEKSLTKIGVHFKTTGTTIAARLDEWGIRKKQTEVERKEEEKKKVFEKYDSKKKEILKMYVDNKKSVSFISNLLKLDRGMLVEKIKIWGIKINYSSNNAKTYDESFFEKIDTEEKAYWLGFIYADGCIVKNHSKDKQGKQLRKYSLNIELAEKDKEHLIKFAKTICLNFEESMLYSRERKIYYDHLDEERTYEMCAFQVTSKKIVEDLIKLGCIPNKSLTLEFPKEEQVPKYLWMSFIRGYFDGDGWINNDGKNNLKLGMIGTENFLNKIESFFVETFDWYTVTKRGKAGRARVLIKGITTKRKEFMETFYKNAETFLERKYNIFLNSMPSETENK